LRSGLPEGVSASADGDRLRSIGRCASVPAQQRAAHAEDDEPAEHRDGQERALELARARVLLLGLGRRAALGVGAHVITPHRCISETVAIARIRKTTPMNPVYIHRYRWSEAQKRRTAITPLTYATAHRARPTGAATRPDRLSTGTSTGIAR